LIIIGLVFHARRLQAKTAVMRADPDTILADPVLSQTALRAGRHIFLARCASCHGTEGKSNPARAIPDLTDTSFLYGDGRVSDIERIVLHGIRAGDTKGWNLASMPAYGRLIPYDREPLPSLNPGEIAALVAWLRSANGHSADPAQVQRGRKLFSGNAACWDCHEEDATGDSAIGAPNLIDGEWLNGTGKVAEITDIIEHGRAGVSPAYARVLTPFEARAVAAYTASLHPSSAQAVSR